MRRFIRRAGAVLAAGAVLSLLAAGCSIREEITLSPDGSGTANLRVDLHPIMISYMNDLMAAMTGVEGEYPLFDLEQLAASFAERDGIELVAANQLSRGSLELEARFRDINAILAREDATGILNLARSGDRRELTIRLNREAVQRFLEFAPEESMTMAQFLFPPVDGSVSREEYRDEMAWALEEYEDRETVERVLDEAEIEVRIKPVGTIVSQRGGEIQGDTVVFRIPLLVLLTLEEMRTYSVVFVP